MIRTKLLLTIMLLQAFGMVAMAQPRINPKQLKINGDYIHKATSTFFPERLFDYTRKSIYSFDKKNLDIGVTYEQVNGSLKTTVSVYIYPADDGVESRLRNEYTRSLQSIAYYSANGINATQYPVRYEGEKYICNGYKAETKLTGNDLSQLLVYECGTWFLKIRVTSNQADTTALNALEDKVVQNFDPARLTALHPLNEKANIYVSRAAIRDSTLLRSCIRSANTKIEWANENIDAGERASGFPDQHLYMHIASLLEFAKSAADGKHPRSAETQAYLDELNSIIDSGFIAEFIMEQFGMIMIVPEDVSFDFEGYRRWKQSHKITIDLNKRFILIAYGKD